MEEEENGGKARKLRGTVKDLRGLGLALLTAHKPLFSNENQPKPIFIILCVLPKTNFL
ncbi:uncharacterized protein G2W53_043749 [Senna tora]|uniref:Uncharacterized protein n=1 Tax=Senna tora TaxID=362788 RepID=A0A834SI89_9FABA|nr:uncharacterized protein G2W53_043749 [Senna tora]